VLLIQRVEELQSRAIQTENDSRKYKSESETKNANLKKENFQLKDRIRDAEEKERIMYEHTQLELSRSKSKIERLELELQHFKSHPVSKRLKIETPERPMLQILSSDKKEIDLLSSLHEKNQKRIQELEKEKNDLLKSNEFYQGMHQNIEKLQETIRSLHYQLQMLDSTRNENSKLSIQLEELQREKEDWHRVCGESGFKSPFELFERLNLLKMTNLELLQQIQSKDLQIRSLQESNSFIELENNAKLKELSILTETLAQKENVERRNNVRITILTSENGRLKELLVFFLKSAKL
jgi:DNA repair exonuclease SbcCD ATPase subunit